VLPQPEKKLKSQRKLTNEKKQAAKEKVARADSQNFPSLLFCKRT